MSQLAEIRPLIYSRMLSVGNYVFNRLHLTEQISPYLYQMMAKSSIPSSSYPTGTSIHQVSSDTFLEHFHHWATASNSTRPSHNDIILLHPQPTPSVHEDVILLKGTASRMSFPCAISKVQLTKLP